MISVIDAHVHFSTVDSNRLLALYLTLCSGLVRPSLPIYADSLRLNLSQLSRLSMNCPYQPARRSVRYHLHLPVSVKLANKEILARSENISLSGILLISASLIPVGCTVELTVGAVQMPERGLPLAARGKVLRVQQQASGNFSVAIECDRAFELMRSRL